MDKDIIIKVGEKQESLNGQYAFLKECEGTEPFIYEDAYTQQFVLALIDKIRDQADELEVKKRTIKAFEDLSAKQGKALEEQAEEIKKLKEAKETLHTNACESSLEWLKKLETANEEIKHLKAELLKANIKIEELNDLDPDN